MTAMPASPLPEPREADDEIEIGECFFCKEQKEIVATMNVSAHPRGGDEVIGTTGEQDACEDCVLKAINEMRRIAAAKGASHV